MKTTEELKSEMNSLKQEYEKNAESANFGSLVALTSGKLVEMHNALNDQNIAKKKVPEVINVEHFVEHYCSDLGAKAFLGYLLGLDDDYVISFIALIEFMHADFYIDSEIPMRGIGEYFTIMEHYFWPSAAISPLEYCLLTDIHLDTFITDYRVGKIKIDFNSFQLLSHLIGG